MPLLPRIRGESMTDPLHCIGRQVPGQCGGGREGPIGLQEGYEFTVNRAVEGRNQSIHSKTKKMIRLCTLRQL